MNVLKRYTMDRSGRASAMDDVGGPRMGGGMSGGEPILMGYERDGNALASAVYRPEQDAASVHKVLFMGDKWSGANHDDLARAKQLESQGVPRDEIWKQTLWGKTPEGHWVTESDDRNLSLTPSYWDQVNKSKDALDRSKERGSQGRPLAVIPGNEAIVGAPFIPEQMPPVGLYAGRSTNAGFRPNKDNGEMGVFFPQPGTKQQYDPYDRKWMTDTVTHELQHKADYESHSDPSMAADIRTKSSILPYKRYHDNYTSEVRANAAMARKDMDMDQRRETPMWNSYPIPEDQQIYTTGGGKELNHPNSLLSGVLSEAAQSKKGYQGSLGLVYPYLDKIMDIPKEDAEKLLKNRWSELWNGPDMEGLRGYLLKSLHQHGYAVSKLRGIEPPWMQPGPWSKNNYDDMREGPGY